MKVHGYTLSIICQIAFSWFIHKGLLHPDKKSKSEGGALDNNEYQNNLQNFDIGHCSKTNEREGQKLRFGQKFEFTFV